MNNNMKSENEEVFRPIAGYEDLYLISCSGRVQSLPRWVVCNGVMALRDGRILKGSSHPDRYRIVGLWRDGVRWTSYIHRLVAQAFLSNPDGKPQVNHIDGDKANNRMENLEWVTDLENKRHAMETGLTIKGEDHGNSKLTEEEVLYIRSNPDGLTQRELATKLEVSQSVICNIQLGKTWGHVQ